MTKDLDTPLPQTALTVSRRQLLIGAAGATALAALAASAGCPARHRARRHVWQFAAPRPLRSHNVVVIHAAQDEFVPLRRS